MNNHLFSNVDVGHEMVPVIEGANVLNIDANGLSGLLGDEILPFSVMTRVDLNSVTVDIKESLAQPLVFSIANPNDINIVVKSKKRVQLVINALQSSRLNVRFEEGAQGDLFCLPVNSHIVANLLYAVQLEKDAHLRVFEFGLSNEKTTRSIDVLLNGENANISYFGVDQLHGDARKNSSLSITHRARCSSSTQSFRGVYGGAANARFLGKVIVLKDADGCKAEQLYKSILLSDQAHVHVNPELEIYNSDVSASHGASIGELDAAQIFYLRSRGFSLSDANALLINSMLDDVFDEIDKSSVKNTVLHLFSQAMLQALLVQP